MSSNRMTDLVTSKTEDEFEEKLKALDGVDKAVLEREFFESLEENIGKKIEIIKEAIEMKIKLKEVSQIVSLSYIAEKYFGKSETWLSQRINENIVDEKRLSLTSGEKETLQKAFREISEKIESMSVDDAF